MTRALIGWSEYQGYYILWVNLLNYKLSGKTFTEDEALLYGSLCRMFQESADFDRSVTEMYKRQMEEGQDESASQMGAS